MHFQLEGLFGNALCIRIGKDVQRDDLRPLDAAACA